MTDLLITLVNSATQAGIIITIFGGGCILWMLVQSTRRTKQSKATKLDAMFLAYSSPGFSRFSLLNIPDNIGIGVFASLALEQVGAIKDIKPQVDVNLRLYPDWSASYLSAARYSALVGDKQKARDYLLVAKTLIGGKKTRNDIPQLKLSIVERLISSETYSSPFTTSIDSMFEELRKKPYQLVLARSFTVFLVGFGLLFCGVLLNIVIKSFTA